MDDSATSLRYKRIRNLTEELCEPLATEDHVVQPVEDVSPPKWHLGHTTWFYEVFILEPFKKDYKAYNPDFHYLFNSYYHTKGRMYVRAERGNLSRPSVESILHYRAYVDNEMQKFLEERLSDEVRKLLEVGLNHEQQHQELLVTDIKYILGNNPLFPRYTENNSPSYEQISSLPEMNFIDFDEGIYEIGYSGDDFAYDNERERHKVYLHPFRIMDRLITNSEFMEFIESGGYEEFRFWLSDGWDWINENNIKSPLYWHEIDGKWHYYTMQGLKPVDPLAPVTHVSYYEAEAFASWKNKRLPTEQEWEAAAKKLSPDIEDDLNFMDRKIYHPAPKKKSAPQFFGDAWEWTGSAYMQYPYYKQPEGALGEYNAKFMSGQMVLRGGSCATPHSHIRHTYRNFFQPEKRWQFTGFRLAENV